MASSINKAQLLGRLGADPELKYTPSGAAVCNLSIATSYKYKDKTSGETVEKTEWHRVVFWNKAAEIVAQYAKKGSRIYVEGSLQTRSWDDNGTKRYTTEVKGEEFVLLDSNTKSDGRGEQHDQEDDPVEQPAPAGALTETDVDDDLPF